MVSFVVLVRAEQCLIDIANTIAEAHLQLAQYFYQLRMEEIREEIEKKEQKFR